MKRHHVLILIIVVIASIILFPFLASYWQINRYDASLQLWEQRKPTHYSYDVIWQDAIAMERQTQHHWQIELQDSQFIQVRDLATGQLLAPDTLYHREEFVLIDKLFLRIDESLPRQVSMGGYIVRAYPSLIRFLSSHSISLPFDWVCVPPLPKVVYDAQWGYPTHVESETNPCFATSSDRTKVKVTINNFQPLP